MKLTSKLLTRAACTATLALLSGCIIPYPHTSERSSEVSGTVLDARTRAPIKGAEVIQSQDPGPALGKTRRRTTDEAGRFRFRASHNFHLATAGPEGADLPHGYEYESLTVLHPGYLSYETWGGERDMKLLLQPARPLDLGGRILDSRTKTPIAGARVYFTYYTKLSCTSDAAGRFRLIPTDDFYYAFETSERSSPLEPFRDWLNVSHQNYMAQTFHGSREVEVLLQPKP